MFQREHHLRKVIRLVYFASHVKMAQVAATGANDATSELETDQSNKEKSDHHKPQHQPASTRAVNVHVVTTAAASQDK